MQRDEYVAILRQLDQVGAVVEEQPDCALDTLKSNNLLSKLLEAQTPSAGERFIAVEGCRRLLARASALSKAKKPQLPLEEQSTSAEPEAQDARKRIRPEDHSAKRQKSNVLELAEESRPTVLAVSGSNGRVWYYQLVARVGPHTIGQQLEYEGQGRFVLADSVAQLEDQQILETNVKTAEHSGIHISLHERRRLEALMAAPKRRVLPRLVPGRVVSAWGNDETVWYYEVTADSKHGYRLLHVPESDTTQRHCYKRRFTNGAVDPLCADMVFDFEIDCERKDGYLLVLAADHASSVKRLQESMQCK